MQGYIGADSTANLNTDYRLNLTKHIDHEFEEEASISRSKDGHNGVFTRERKLTLKRLVFLIMTFKTSVQRDLDRFYKRFPMMILISER